jgi:hypothetical protein
MFTKYLYFIEDFIEVLRHLLILAEI